MAGAARGSGGGGLLNTMTGGAAGLATAPVAMTTGLVGGMTGGLLGRRLASLAEGAGTRAGGRRALLQGSGGCGYNFKSICRLATEADKKLWDSGATGSYRCA